MLSRWRINLFIGVLLAVTGLVFYRLIYLAQIRHEHFVKVSDMQYQSRQESTARRGAIYINDFSSGEKQAVALQKSFPYIYVIPKESKDTASSAQKLVGVIGWDLEAALQIFSKKDDPFEVVKTNPTDQELEAVRALNTKEISIGYEERRFYPESNFLSQVLGFLGFEGDKRVGQYGLESFYEKNLSASIFSSSKSTQEEVKPDGEDLVLTIDRNVQLFAQKELDYLMKKWTPTSGVIIVQDPNDGSVIAMVGSPSFDPNNYGQYRLEDFTNKNVQEMFEPGSSFKPLTMAAALDKKRVTPETTYYDTGETEIAGFKIRNFNEKAFGTQTMNQVLEKSLNLGAMFAQEKLGDDNFLDYVINFGFGQLTGIDLGGEVAGDISNLYTKRKVNFATASFGQGIAVTPIQLANSYSALANGGKLYRPFIVKERIKSNGERIVTKPELIGTPISERASSQIKAMLVRVVENGFDHAIVPGYDVAGKTGTAQVASKEGGYSEEFIHDIVGFAPAFSPRFVILIKLESPQGIKFAADSLSPSLGTMTRFLLNYFKIPPSK
ncbi:MAG: penicillin-binding protein 2 [bacterium]|nr:penicillin-binding protein 2 [bacterium]